MCSLFRLFFFYLFVGWFLFVFLIPCGRLISFVIVVSLFHFIIVDDRVIRYLLLRGWCAVCGCCCLLEFIFISIFFFNKFSVSILLCVLCCYVWCCLLFVILLLTLLCAIFAFCMLSFNIKFLALLPQSIFFFFRLFCYFCCCVLFLLHSTI